MNCKICQGSTRVLGERTGQYAKRQFVLRRCETCQFAFVEEPWLDYAKIYDEAYYEGRGADPMVDYRFELAEPERTIRRFEWAGIVDVVSRLVTLDTRTRWLDFGCGGGGLPRYAKARVGCEAVGFEEGAIALKARQHSIPILDRSELDAQEGSFDVVTAIEVMEHVADPLATLTQIRRLLRPGGVLFYTTGNARPFRERLTSWSYFTPEIHISLYEPSSMERALRLTGFDVTYPGFIPGWEQIMAFKVLKNLGVRRISAAHRAIPWGAITPMLNWRFGLYDFPVATAV